MLIRYTTPEGERKTIPLTDRPVTIGRGEQADVVIHDEKASRMHLGLRREGDGLHVRDLKSKNGVYVNGERVSEIYAQAGDRIRVGSTILVVEAGGQEGGAGTTEVLHAVQEEMEGGKGYRTMLKEIVEDVPRTTRPQKK